MTGLANLAPRRVVVSGLHLPRPQARSEPRRAAKIEEPTLPYPEPEVMARTAHEDEIPRAVRTFTRKLDDAGIRHDVRYARGWLPDNQGNPTKIVESIAVRMDLACAVWHDGRFAFGLVRLPEFGLRKVNLDQVKAFLGFEVKARAPRATTEKPKLRVIKGGKEGMR